MNDWEAPLVALLELQRRLERGPKREGTFALWMLVRLALDLGLAKEPPDKADRRRVTLLGQRLAPLAVPRPLARGLTTALRHLEDGSATGARIALSQLVAPTKDALGNEAADAVALAAKLVHDRRA